MFTISLIRLFSTMQGTSFFKKNFYVYSFLRDRDSAIRGGAVRQ